MEFVLTITAFVCLLLGIFWNTDDFANIFIKLVLLGLGISNAIMLAHVLGYIVKVVGN